MTTEFKDAVIRAYDVLRDVLINARELLSEEGFEQAILNEITTQPIPNPVPVVVREAIHGHFEDYVKRWNRKHGGGGGMSTKKQSSARSEEASRQDQLPSAAASSASSASSSSQKLTDVVVLVELTNFSKKDAKTAAVQAKVQSLWKNKLISFLSVFCPRPESSASSSQCRCV